MGTYQLSNFAFSAKWNSVLHVFSIDHVCILRYNGISDGGWPAEPVQELDKFQPYFGIVQRMQTWMHHVCRYDGWFESPELVETTEAIEARREWIQTVARSFFTMLTEWDDNENSAYYK